VERRVRVRFGYQGWLFDLDGTVYVGERLIPGAAEAIAALRGAGRRLVFLSNKPLETRADYARKLSRLGIPAAAEDVVNSSLVLARHLRGLDPGAPVYVIGEPPMLAEMRAHGFEVRDDERVRWVVIAFDRTFSYAKLNTALQAVRQGARLIATNPDRTCPVEGGEIPDCAGMIAAVEAVTDRKVEAIVGKPSPIILEVALDALGVPAGDAVIVGDRVETDIAMGRRLGLGTILVLSGVTRAGDPRIAALAPDHVLGSIAELIER
jgi:NagD protein